MVKGAGSYAIVVESGRFAGNGIVAKELGVVCIMETLVM